MHDKAEQANCQKRQGNVFVTKVSKNCTWVRRQSVIVKDRQNINSMPHTINKHYESSSEQFVTAECLDSYLQ